jgi:hypothetical protein
MTNHKTDNANLINRTMVTSLLSFVTVDCALYLFFRIWLKMAHHGHGGLGEGDCVTEINTARPKLHT